MGDALFNFLRLHAACRPGTDCLWDMADYILSKHHAHHWSCKQHARVARYLCYCQFPALQMVDAYYGYVAIAAFSTLTGKAYPIANVEW